MQENFVVDLLVISHHEYIFCSSCDARVARVNDYVCNPQDSVYGGYFIELRNTDTIENPTNHLHGNTQLVRYNTYCMRCKVLLGWQIAESIPPSEYFVPGRFFMELDQLMFWNLMTLRDYHFRGPNAQAPNNQVEGGNVQAPNNQAGGANVQAPNEQNANQDGGANDKDGGVVPNEEDVGANEQVGGANDQDGGVNELVPNEQDIGATDQVGGANDQDGGVNELVPNEQDEDANEQNDDQDGAAPAKRRKM